MKLDFDRVVERRHTGSYKWDKYGDDVIPLWVADMDFASPEIVIRALREAVSHGIFGYTYPMKEIYTVIQDRLKNLYQWEVKEEEIVLLPGLVTGINLAFHVYAGHGDGVLAQTPVYFHFLKDPLAHGRTLQDPSLIQKGDTYEIDFDTFEASVADRTKVFIL